MEVGKPYTIAKGGPTSNYNKDSKIDIVTVNDGKRYPKTVLRFKRDRPKIHPTQKPVELCEYLIRTYTNEHALILDNCAGAGTTTADSSGTARRRTTWSPSTCPASRASRLHNFCMPKRFVGRQGRRPRPTDAPPARRAGR